MILELIATLVIVFHGGDPANVDVSEVGDTSKIPQADKWFPWTGGSDPAQDYTFDGNGLKKKTKPPIFPIDPDGFVNDLAGDSTIPTALVDRASATIYRLAYNDLARKAYWARIIANPPSGLTAGLITTIQNYAAARNMPLQ